MPHAMFDHEFKTRLLETLTRMEHRLMTIQDDVTALTQAVSDLAAAQQTGLGLLSQIEAKLATALAGSTDPTISAAIEAATAQLGQLKSTMTDASTAAEAVLNPPAPAAAPDAPPAPASS